MFYWIKIIIIFLSAICVAAILFFTFLWLPFLNKIKPVEFGVSFSKPYAELLGLDWKKVYLSVLEDLGASKVRINSEWDKIEESEGVYDFSALDWQIDEAEKRGVGVLLVVGERQPRWPECHTPKWLAESPRAEIQERALEFIRVVAERYKNSPVIEMWQVENEPLFDIFGKCPKGDVNFLKREIDLIKSLDDRPVLITDSGELSTWRRTASLGDFFGFTIYRTVHNRYVGYFHHFFAPAFFKLKAKLVGLSPDKVIISELQAEPWFGDESNLEYMSPEEQKKIMSLEKIAGQIDFAKKTGFPRAYIWGVEWWYWMKEQGDDSIWQFGKKIWEP